MAWLALVGLLAAGCPSSNVSAGKDASAQDGAVADGTIADGSTTVEGYDGGPLPGDLDAMTAMDGEGHAPEVVCDAFVHVDFPCSRERVCVSAAEYEQFETVPCGEEYPKDCCSGASCESTGIFACPEGTHCVESGDEQEDDQCLPDATCPGGPAGTVLFEFHSGGEIRSTPAVGDDGTIYFGTQAAAFFALSCDGEEQWQWEYACSDPWCPQAFEGSPALSEDGTIYVGDDIAVPNYLFALGPAGDVLWTWETMQVYGQMDASPAVASDGTIWAAGHGESGYVGPLGMVVALDPTGKALPGFPVNTGPIRASPVLYNDVLFAAESGPTGRVIAVDREATLLWETEIAPGAWESIPSSLAVDSDGMLLVAHQVDMGGDNGPYVPLSRMDPADGEVVWQVTLENSARPEGAPVIADTAFGMHVALALSDGRVIVANPYSGGIQYQEVHASVDFGDYVRGGPVFGDDGALYAITAVNMVTDAPFMGICRIDLETGEEETWPIGTSPDIITTSLQMAPGGAILFGTMTGRLYAWQSAATGPATDAAWPSFRKDRRNSGNGGGTP